MAPTSYSEGRRLPTQKPVSTVSRPLWPISIYRKFLLYSYIRRSTCRQSMDPLLTAVMAQGPTNAPVLTSSVTKCWHYRPSGRSIAEDLQRGSDNEPSVLLLARPMISDRQPRKFELLVLPCQLLCGHRSTSTAPYKYSN